MRMNIYTQCKWQGGCAVAVWGGGSERALTIHAGLAGREYTKRKREKTTMSEICGKQDSLAPH